MNGFMLKVVFFTKDKGVLKSYMRNGKLRSCLQRTTRWQYVDFNKSTHPYRDFLAFSFFKQNKINISFSALMLAFTAY